CQAGAKRVPSGCQADRHRTCAPRRAVIPCVPMAPRLLAVTLSARLQNCRRGSSELAESRSTPGGEWRMLSVYLDSSPLRKRISSLLGSVSERTYYSAFAPLRMRRINSPMLPDSGWLRVRNHIAGISERDVDQVRLVASRQVSIAAAPRQRRNYLGTEVV